MHCRATEQTVTIYGAATYEAGELKSQRVKATLHGVGSATVWAVEELDATIRGVGEVSYYGSPTVRQLVMSQQWGESRVWATTRRQFVLPMALSCAPIPCTGETGAIMEENQPQYNPERSKSVCARLLGSVARKASLAAGLDGLERWGQESDS
jgi:hypothetical protein